MAIIINEFEIVAPPDGAANRGDERSAPRAGASEMAPAAVVQPVDVEEIIRRALQRRLRVWAD
jgi:hypothetical protein